MLVVCLTTFIKEFDVDNDDRLIDWVRLNVPPTHYRSYGDGFLRVKWPNQQCQRTEGTHKSKQKTPQCILTKEYR